MREAESCSSAARPRAVSDAATQRSAAPVAGPASVAHLGQPGARRRRPPPAARPGARPRGRRGPRGARASRPRRRRRRAPSSAVALPRRARAPRAAGRRAARRRSRSTPGLHELAERRADDVERVGQVGRGALDGRGRVVELVGEPRRHRPQRLQALAVLLGAGQARHHRLHLPHDALVHRRMREREAAEVVGRDERDLARRRSAAMRTASGPRVRTAMAPIQVGADLAPDRLGAAVVDDRRSAPRPRAGRRARATSTPCSASSSPGSKRSRCATAAHSASCVVVEVVEEVDRAQVGDGDRGRGAHAWARYSWMSETAIEPSPTALATRLIERARTSPATKTPGHARLQQVGVAAAAASRPP